jgi:hypothetical protein
VRSLPLEGGRLDQLLDALAAKHLAFPVFLKSGAIAVTFRHAGFSLRAARFAVDELSRSPSGAIAAKS